MHKQVINIYWVRHGYSCANHAKQTGMLTRLASHFRYDPPLTDFSIETMRQARPHMPWNDDTVDIFCASVLLRAIETCLYMFPSHKPVWVLPYVSESNKGLDNSPMSIPQQIHWLNLQNPGLLKRVKWGFVSQDRAAKSKSSYPEFLQWFPQALPTLLKLNKIPWNQPVVNLVIVSHSHFLRENFTMTGKNTPSNKPWNNAVVKVMYHRRMNRQGRTVGFRRDENCPGRVITFRPKFCKKFHPCSGLRFCGFKPPKTIRDFKRKGGGQRCILKHELFD